MSAGGPSDPSATGGSGVCAQDVALLGLRRRLQQQRQGVSDSNSIVARIRRRHEAVDDVVRRNAQNRADEGAGHASPLAHHGVMRELLTQAHGAGAGASVRPVALVGVDGSPRGSSHPSSPEEAFPPVPSPPSGSRPSAPHRRGYVDEARLHELRKKPKNLSPCSGFHLDALLPPQELAVKDRITLILDVDETLVHASFTNSKPFDTRLTVETETERGYIYVAFRPRLAEFLDFCASRFEVVVFTASMSVYANQLMDQLDPTGKLGRLRLFREHCTEMRNARVKDLSLLGRPLDRIAIIDNSHVAYLFQPRNAIPIVSWFDDRRDTEFERLMPMLEELAECESVYDVLDVWNCTVY